MGAGSLKKPEKKVLGVPRKNSVWPEDDFLAKTSADSEVMATHSLMTTEGHTERSSSRKGHTHTRREKPRTREKSLVDDLNLKRIVRCRHNSVTANEVAEKVIEHVKAVQGRCGGRMAGGGRTGEPRWRLGRAPSHERKLATGSPFIGIGGVCLCQTGDPAHGNCQPVLEPDR